jgi:hypothetical protein
MTGRVGFENRGGAEEQSPKQQDSGRSLPLKPPSVSILMGGKPLVPKRKGKSLFTRSSVQLLKRRMAELSVGVAVLVPDGVELARGKLEHTSRERAAHVLRSLPLLVVE